MANTKISALSSLAQASVVPASDVLPIVNASTTKKITVDALVNSQLAQSATTTGIGVTSPVLRFAVERDNGSGYVASFRNASGSPYITIQTTGGITQLQGINSAFTNIADIGLQPSGGDVKIGGNLVINTSGKGVQFANTTWLETVVASYKKSASTTVATGSGRSDQYFLVAASKTFTITSAGLGGLVTIVNGSSGEACTFFWSWNTATITILGNGGTSFVASASPILAQLGISKSANSSVLTFKTGASFSTGNVSVCLLNDYASSTTDPA